MKQRITFRRAKTVTFEFEVEEPLKHSSAEFWAQGGFCGGSMVDRCLAEKQGSYEIVDSKWEAVEADPPFAAEPVGTVRRARKSA